MGDFVMPSLGADMDEGTVVEWLVKVGDHVHRGDIVAVVDTTKSAIEVEVFSDGVVEEILVEPGRTVPVGTPLARLGARDAAAPEPAGTPVAEPAPEVPTAASVPAAPAVASPIVRHLAHEKGVDLATVQGSGPDGVITRTDVLAATTAAAGGSATEPKAPAARPRVSPLARRTAAELGLDLALVTGTGARGAVTAGDVRQAAADAAAATPGTQPAEPATPVQQSGTESTAAAAQRRAAAMRQTIANLMARSKKEIPHYYLRTTVDFSAANDFVRRHNDGRPVSERLLPAAVLLKAAALAVRKVPEVNGFFVDGAFQRSEHVHLGVAVSLRGGGLVAPAIHDADTLALPELMVRLKDLVARTRAGRLRGSEMADPTITVTNLGEQGVEVVHGVIYPPQVALVGFGTVVSRPWAVDGMLTVRPVVTVTLAADHRVSDGHRGGLYVSAVQNLLQRPEEL
jgi:pyruvate dehydrogenase E2 component (dihydrolipoamide acetyltransferase)